jgi:hypothetical protein
VGLKNVKLQKVENDVGEQWAIFLHLCQVLQFFGIVQ